MDQQFDLERLIAQWKRDYGKLVRSKKWHSEYYQIPISDRFELLKVLVKQIRDNGKIEEYFHSSSVKDKIVDACIPHEKSLSNPQSYGLFQKGARDHLKMAIVDIFSEEPPKSKSEEKPFTKEFDPSSVKSIEPERDDVIDPEMAELLGYNDE